MCYGTGEFIANRHTATKDIANALGTNPNFVGGVGSEICNDVSCPVATSLMTHSTTISDRLNSWDTATLNTTIDARIASSELSLANFATKDHHHDGTYASFRHGDGSHGHLAYARSMMPPYNTNLSIINYVEVGRGFCNADSPPGDYISTLNTRKGNGDSIRAECAQHCSQDPQCKFFSTTDPGYCNFFRGCTKFHPTIDEQDRRTYRKMTPA